MRKKDGNNCVRILTRDDRPDFAQVEIVGPDRVRTGSKGRGALWELKDLLISIGEDHNNSNVGWGEGIGTSSINSTLEVVEFAGEVERGGSLGEWTGE